MPAILQPRFGEDAYPIGRLVLERARRLGMSRTDLVRRRGYGNLSNGQGALTRLLRSGIVAPFLAPRLTAALEVEQDLIDQTLMATDIQREDEAAVERIGEATLRIGNRAAPVPSDFSRDVILGEPTNFELP